MDLHILLGSITCHKSCSICLNIKNGPVAVNSHGCGSRGFCVAVVSGCAFGAFCMFYPAAARYHAAHLACVCTNDGRPYAAQEQVIGPGPVHSPTLPCYNSEEGTKCLKNIANISNFQTTLTNGFTKNA